MESQNQNQKPKAPKKPVKKKPVQVLNLPEGVSHSVKHEFAYIQRSQIVLADYNPRIMSDESRALLRRSIKTHGLVEALVWNKRTGRLVGGHQRITELDSIENYNPQTHENDYKVPCCVVDVEEKQEMEMNIMLNSPALQGEYDFQRMAEFDGQIDWNNAGMIKDDVEWMRSLVLEQSFENKSIEEIIDQFEDIKEVKKASVPEDEYLQRKAESLARKQIIKDTTKETTQYVNIVFSSSATKIRFLQLLDIEDINREFVTIATVAEKLQLPIELEENNQDGDQAEDNENNE